MTGFIFTIETSTRKHFPFGQWKLLTLRYSYITKVLFKTKVKRTLPDTEWISFLLVDYGESIIHNFSYGKK